MTDPRERSIEARKAEPAWFERDLVGHASFVTACATLPNGVHVVSASYDHSLKIWDLDAGQPIATLQGHADKVLACAVLSDGRRVVSASADRTLKIWDLDAGQPIATLQGHAHAVTACAVTPDGQRLVSASCDQALKIWDLDAGQPIATLQGHARAVTACAVTPDGRRLVSASEDKTLKVWDLDTGQLAATLQGHRLGVTACAVTPDGRRIVSASYDQTLKVWDLITGQSTATLQGHASFVLACAVTPDGRRLISASEDKMLKIWDLDAGHSIATLQGHSSFVTACAVTPDGRRLISASCDKTLKVWDLDAEQPAAVQDHTSSVTACTVIPDGRRVIPVSDEQVLARGNHSDNNHLGASRSNKHLSPRLWMKHMILFLAANPLGSDRLALDEECAAIERELRMTSGRDDFDFRSKWAVNVDELVRHLNELQPTILHFSGHGSTGAAGSWRAHSDPQREVELPRSAGVVLQNEGGSQYVGERALAKLIASAAPSTRVVVLNACFSAAVAESLRHVVDCVVGMDGALGDAAARSFAVAFYRALGNRRSVGNAVAQAAATLAAKQFPDDLPICRTRNGLSGEEIFLHTSAPSWPDPAEP